MDNTGESQAAVLNRLFDYILEHKADGLFILHHSPAGSAPRSWTSYVLWLETREVLKNRIRGPTEANYLQPVGSYTRVDTLDHIPLSQQQLHTCHLSFLFTEHRHDCCGIDVNFALCPHFSHHWISYSQLLKEALPTLSSFFFGASRELPPPTAARPVSTAVRPPSCIDRCETVHELLSFMQRRKQKEKSRRNQYRDSALEQQVQQCKASYREARKSGQHVAKQEALQLGWVLAAARRASLYCKVSKHFRNEFSLLSFILMEHWAQEHGDDEAVALYQKEFLQAFKVYKMYDKVALALWHIPGSTYLPPTNIVRRYNRLRFLYPSLLQLDDSHGVMKVHGGSKYWEMTCKTCSLRFRDEWSHYQARWVSVRADTFCGQQKDGLQQGGSGSGSGKRKRGELEDEEVASKLQEWRAHIEAPDFQPVVLPHELKLTQSCCSHSLQDTQQHLKRLGKLPWPADGGPALRHAIFYYDAIQWLQFWLHKKTLTHQDCSKYGLPGKRKHAVFGELKELHAQFPQFTRYCEYDFLFEHVRAVRLYLHNTPEAALFWQQQVTA